MQELSRESIEILEKEELRLKAQLRRYMSVVKDEKTSAKRKALYLTEIMSQRPILENVLRMKGQFQRLNKSIIDGAIEAKRRVDAKSPRLKAGHRTAKPVKMNSEKDSALKESYKWKSF